MKTAIWFTIAIFMTLLGSIGLLFSGFPLWALLYFGAMLCGMIVAIIGLIAKRAEKGFHPDLEQRADVLSLSHNADEIKHFIYTKGTYLSKSGYAKLIARLEMLDAESTIFEDNLKARIEEVAKPEQEEEYGETRSQSARH